MPHSINHITLLGNVGGVKVFNNMTRIRLATSRAVKQDGEWSETTDWHNVVTFGRTAEYAAVNVRIGDKVAVQGKLVTTSYEGKDGQKVYMSEIHCRELIQLTKREKRVNGPEEGTEEIPF